MNLTVHDRKLLWGRAADRCSICRIELFVGKTPVDRESIIGDEAHIIGASPDGPRGRGGTRTALDTYENAILLCKNDHRMIDEQPNKFTPELLRDLKSDHETWVKATLNDAQRAEADRIAVGVAKLVGPPAEEQRMLMTQFSPTNWCLPPAASWPELVLRIVVATPEPVQIGPSAHNGGSVTLMRGEDRDHNPARAGKWILDTEERPAAIFEPGIFPIRTAS